MKKTVVILTLILISFGCNKDNENKLDNYFDAEIVDFDLNCTTCILRFPNDSIIIKQMIGQSKNNYYQTTNLSKDTFKIGQKIFVKLRKAVDNELRACKTLYPSYNYTTIYIVDFKTRE